MTVLAVRVVIGAALDGGFGATLKSAESRLAKLGAAAGKVRPDRGTADGFRELGDALGSLGAPREAAELGMDSLRKESAGVEIRLNAATRAVREHGAAVGDAAERHRRFAAELRSSGDLLARFGKGRAAEPLPTGGVPPLAVGAASAAGPPSVASTGVGAVGKSLESAREALDLYGDLRNVVTLPGDLRAAWERLPDATATVGDRFRTVGERLRNLGRTALVTNLHMKALAVGGAVQGFGRALLGLASGGIRAAIVAFRALTVAIVTNPVGLIVTAVVVAAALIYRYWEPISKFFGWLWNGIVGGAKAAFGWIAAGVAPVARLFGRIFGAVFGLLRRGWDGLVAGARAALGWVSAKLAAAAAFFGGIFGAVFGLLRRGWDGLVTGARVAFDWVSAKLAAAAAFFGQIFGAVFGLLRRGWDGLVAGARAALDWVSAKLAAAAAFFGQIFGGLWAGLKAGFTGAWDAVKGSLGAAIEWLQGFSLVDIGKALIGSLGEGIRAAGAALVETVGSVFSWLEPLLPGSDAREGPLSNLTGSGAAIVDTLGQGVRRAGPTPLRRPLQTALAGAAAGPNLPAAAGSAPGVPAPAAPLAQGGRSAPQIVVSPGAIAVHVHGSGADPHRIADEIERQLASIMRRAANEAAAAQTDLAA